jgi:hypothetical protein
MLSTTPSSTSDEGAPRTLPAQEKEPENRGRYTYRRVDLRQPHPARAADALFSLIKTNLWLIIASFVKELRI